MNYSIREPSLRVNISSSFGITTSWQTVVFNGTSALNFNYYPKDPTTGNQMIHWDGVNNKFRVYGDYNRQITLQLFAKTTTTIIATSSNLQMRIVIPNGVSPGVDFYFPFPEDGGLADIADITKLTEPLSFTITPLSIYSNSAIIANGFYIQLRLSTPLLGLGTCTLNAANVVIQSNF